MHRNSYEKKVAYKAATIGFVWSSMPSHGQPCLNLSEGDFVCHGGGNATLKIVENERLINF